MKNKSLQAGIMGAGLGSRLHSPQGSKPLTILAGKTLLERTIENLQACSVQSITCALRAELTPKEIQSKLPSPPEFPVHYIYVNTESSLHTLSAVINAMPLRTTHPALFTMIDTVVRRDDLLDFAKFCENQEPETCVLLVTSFVDDESPLWVRAGAQQEVLRIGEDKGDYVTSGVYYLSPRAQEMAQLALNQGIHKMRNYLNFLLNNQVPMKVFAVTKTIDVDHSSDLTKAEQFLQ